MSKALIYRFTFIDIEDADPEVAGLSKSKSMPALPITLDPENEAQMSETQQREYVSSLPLQVGPAPGHALPNAAPDVVDEEPEEVQLPAELAESTDEPQAAAEELLPPPAWPSCGSVGHPELCCRPCVHHLAGRCVDGDGCGYCHMQHRLQPKLDKLQRGFVQELPPAALLATILPRLHARAEASGIAEPVAPVLRLVESKLAMLGPLESDHVNLKKLKNLSKALSKMSFSNLLKMAGRAPMPADTALELREALEGLRQQFALMPPMIEAEAADQAGGEALGVV